MTASTQHIPDAELLDRYVSTRSEESFAAIVQRHVDLVYATSLRCLKDAHLAEDVTQAVFLVLARKANRLPRATILPGWLYQTARFISSDAIKMKMRREHHERHAAISRADSAAADSWDEISPHLEAALDALRNSDRNLILLRFFQQMEIPEIARALNASANTVSKRLQRALERLRGNFARQDVAAPSAALESAIAAHAARGAPPSLASLCMKQFATPTPAINALARAATRGAMLWTKTAAVAVICLIATAGATAILLNPSTPARTFKSPAIMPAAALTGPLEPTSEKQLQAIRAQIYILRYCHIFVKNDEWGNAMRVLADIGRPAVPELVAELNRTDRDATIRAIVFTLRAIGDPRACPALIDAIDRTPVRSSDCGLMVTDPKAAKFMHDNQLDHYHGQVEYGRAIREICGTLSKITGHTIGNPARIDASQDTPAATNHARKQHEELRSQWKTWWIAHHNEFVTDADLASLTDRPHESADIKLAGEAVYGPLFPTGSPNHLGPIHDEVLHVWDEQLDTTEVIDFDTEQKMTLMEMLLRAPPLPRPIQNNPLGAAIGRTGAVCYEHFRRILPPASGQNAHGNSAIIMGQPDPTSRYFWLEAMDETMWPVDGALWDSLAQKIESGREIVSTAGTPSFEFDSENEKTLNTFPATFLIRTETGRAGIVQMIGNDDQAPGVHFRYRMVESGNHPAVQFPPAPPPPLAAFGPIREAIIEPRSAGSKCVLDLDTGEVLTLPQGSPETVNQWLADRSLAVSMMDTSHNIWGAMLQNIGGGRVSDAAFDRLSPGIVLQLLDRLASSEVKSSALFDLTAKGRKSSGTIQSASTAIYRTPNGRSGIIQAVDVPGIPNELKIRYRVITLTH